MSSSSEGTLAFARCAAIPDPITPAPNTPTLRISLGMHYLLTVLLLTTGENLPPPTHELNTRSFCPAPVLLARGRKEGLEGLEA